MDTRQLTAALSKIYNDEGQRIVFWHDPEQEFLSVLPTLALDGVELLRLDEMAALAVKIRLEREDATGRYLLYAPHAEPDYESDWLLDIRLYSRSFRADRASIILDELGLVSQHLRQHLAERRKFFDSKDRLQKLKQIVAATDIEADLDRKMMAVVTKADQPELFSLIRTIFHAYTEQGEEIDLETEPGIWEQMAKFDLTESFWQMVKTSFGYEDEAPTLKKFLLRLFLTDFAQQLQAPLPAALQHLVLPASGRQNAPVCLAQWRDSRSLSSSYDRLATLVFDLTHLKEHLHPYDLHDLVSVMTFAELEPVIASELRQLVQTTATTINVDEVRAIASRRQAGHWVASSDSSSDVPRQKYYAVYNALVQAAEFYALRNQYQNGFHFADARAMYQAYEKELYRFDQLYRRFCEEADTAEIWNILKPLREEIEAVYTNWYLPKLALSWGAFVNPEGNTALLKNWRIEKIPNQYQFFERQVKPRLDEAENRKTYVIISDAFRYEAAQELVEELNGKYRFEASLGSQLGVLPSYTVLGMASLLPHETLEYRSGGDVLVDGKPNASLEQRDAILHNVGGMACGDDDLIKKKKEEGRAMVSGKRVVYVYHNAVDATGDTSSTEEQTFGGVRRAIREISELTGYIINSLNGNHVLITADHGFLFTETPPGEPERSKLEERPEGTVKAKKRYLIGLNLPDHESVWHGKTALTAEADGGMEFWIPKGANRFHFVGGARFIHGGAMLQEIVVPVVTVRHVKGKGVKDTKTRPVAVEVLGSNHKITTARHRFELMQMEPVSERLKPVTLKIAVYEGDEAVTNSETITFDSNSERMDERKKSVTLILQDRAYNKKTTYNLVLHNVDDDQRKIIPVVIDRAFSDDF